MRRAAVIAGVVSAVVLASTAAEGALPEIASWEMDESAGATVAVDASGNGLDGAVGSDVQTGVDFGKATGYRFPYITGSSPPRPEHIVSVTETDALDPELARFTVALRFRSRQTWANLVQKGQSGMTGGFWKVDISSGVLTCLFRDGSGQTSTTSSGTPINGDEWHRVRCTRTTEKVVMVIDGVKRDTRNNPTGSINNGAPLTIAGKAYCGDGVECDYWWGDMDYIRIRKG